MTGMAVVYITLSLQQSELCNCDSQVCDTLDANAVAWKKSEPN